MIGKSLPPLVGRRLYIYLIQVVQGFDQFVSGVLGQPDLEFPKKFNLLRGANCQLSPVPGKMSRLANKWGGKNVFTCPSNICYFQDDRPAIA